MKPLRLAVATLLLVSSMALCGMFAAAEPAPGRVAQPRTVLVADEAAVVRVVFVLPASELVPPAAQQRLLQSAAERELKAGNAALASSLAPGGRLLHVEFHANPFATEDNPTADTDALLALGARTVAEWRAQLAAIAAAEARQRQHQMRAKQQQEAAVAKQKSLAAVARVEALKSMLASANDDTRAAITAEMHAAMAELAASMGQVAALRSADLAQAVPMPIVPELVPELGDGPELSRRLSGD